MISGEDRGWGPDGCDGAAVLVQQGLGVVEVLGGASAGSVNALLYCTAGVGFWG